MREAARRAHRRRGGLGGPGRRGRARRARIYATKRHRPRGGAGRGARGGGEGRGVFRSNSGPGAICSRAAGGRAGEGGRVGGAGRGGGAAGRGAGPGAVSGPAGRGKAAGRGGARGGLRGGPDARYLYLSKLGFENIKCSFGLQSAISCHHQLASVQFWPNHCPTQPNSNVNPTLIGLKTGTDLEQVPVSVSYLSRGVTFVIFGRSKLIFPVHIIFN